MGNRRIVRRKDYLFAIGLVPTDDSDRLPPIEALSAAKAAQILESYLHAVAALDESFSSPQRNEYSINKNRAICKNGSSV